MIEMMISLAIVAGMTLITWSVTKQTGDNKKIVGRRADRNHELRVAMTRMSQDLSQAYISANEPGDAMEPRSFFIGKRTGDVPLRFTSFAHRVMWSDANESEQTSIAYYTAPDPDETQITNLLRRESRRLTYEKWDSRSAEIDVLVHDIERFELEYWDWRDKEWQAEWDTSQADGERGRLPSRVRIKVVINDIVDGEKREVVLSTQARVLLEEQLQFFAN
jgi:general secretion pathway protein J